MKDRNSKCTVSRNNIYNSVYSSLWPWVMLSALLLLTTRRVACGCPSDVCICKWKSGKQFVECGGKLLSYLPGGMDTETQVLNFTGNLLQVMQSDSFLKIGLRNLQKLYLSRNQIIKIHDTAFRGLSNLVELDLSDNMLTTLPSKTFQDYSSLMRLILNGNSIGELKNNAFKHLTFLTILELSNCHIYEVHSEAFSGLDNLEWLRLDGNQIKTIKGGKGNVLPTSLHGINMYGNQWNCDCEIVDIHSWLINYKTPQRIEDPRCVHPERLAGETIKFLKAEDLACLPEITPTSLYMEIPEGRNISFICNIKAAPKASVAWWFKGHIIENDTLSPYITPSYSMEKRGYNIQTELFIYNTNTDYNGTFSCIAENSAGRTQANYIIRVIQKIDPPVDSNISNLYQYFMLIITFASVMGFLFIIGCCYILIKYVPRGSNLLRIKKGVPSNNHLDHQSKELSTKVLYNISNDQVPILKSNGRGHIYQQDMMMYINEDNALNYDIQLRNAINQKNERHTANNHYTELSVNNYSEQNPDLVNDANDVGRSFTDTRNNIAGQQDMNIQIDDNNILKTGLHTCDNIGASVMRPASKIIEHFEGINHQVDIHNAKYLAEKGGYPISINIPAHGLSYARHAKTPSRNTLIRQINYLRTSPQKIKHGHLIINSNNGVNDPLEVEIMPMGTRFIPKPMPNVEYALLCNLSQSGCQRQSYTTEIKDKKEVSLSHDKTSNTEEMASNLNNLHWPTCLPGLHTRLKSSIIDHARFSTLFPTSSDNYNLAGNNLLGVVTVPQQFTDPTNLTKLENINPEHKPIDEHNKQITDKRCRVMNIIISNSTEEGYVDNSHNESNL